MPLTRFLNDSQVLAHRYVEKKQNKWTYEYLDYISYLNDNFEKKKLEKKKRKKEVRVLICAKYHICVCICRIPLNTYNNSIW